MKTETVLGPIKWNLLSQLNDDQELVKMQIVGDFETPNSILKLKQEMRLNLSIHDGTPSS